jgi:hypothetical protein
MGHGQLAWTACHLPITGRLELDLDASLLAVLGLLGLPEAGLFVDAELLAAMWCCCCCCCRCCYGRCCCYGGGTADAVLVDADVLLVAGVAAVNGGGLLLLGLLLVDGGREGLAMLFVTFPSDVRSLRR